MTSRDHEPTLTDVADPGLDLESELEALGHGLVFPPTPDLVTPVRTALAEERARPWWARSLTQPVRRSVLLAAAALLLLASVVAGAIYGLGPLRIVSVPTLPSVPPVATATGPLGSNLELGTLTDLDAAVAKVDFTVFAPTSPELATPDAVYYGAALAGGQVSLVYGPAAGRPEPTDSGVSLLITEFPGQMQERLAQKSIGPGTTVEVLTVNGGLAFWIEGAPHVIVYQDPNDQFVHEAIRLVHNSLAWEQDGTVLRIEGDLTRTEALAIAATFARLPG